MQIKNIPSNHKMNSGASAKYTQYHLELLPVLKAAAFSF